MAVAQKELLSMREQPNSGWTEDSKIVDAFPIYLEGLEQSSYLEFKVTTAEMDGGYILVNLDKTDIIVAEASAGGLTLTEQYEKVTGLTDLRIVRHDWARSIAYKKSSDGNDSKIVASLGFDQSGEFNVFENGVLDAHLAKVERASLANRKLVEEKGCIAHEHRESLTDYYDNSLLDTFKILQDQVIDQDFMNYVDSVTPISSTSAENLENHYHQWLWLGWHMPHLKQPKNILGYPVGCGSTAWAMVYAYWKQFKGRSLLFDGYDLTDRWQPESCDWRIPYQRKDKHRFNKWGKIGRLLQI